MAERPLYTLYKNLKAQNYDVPDDYNKFESALTRDGKGGADNRHAIYENLKAQNFDVPSTYERFYSALFEPRSKTSSRAKGGSVPMSAADRARFLAGAQSVLNTARQVKRASGNIRKTVERAKKFNANDGKVTIGFKNPLQNQNVQKNEFNYNATTGKTGTYTTTDGVEFDNEYDASQYQNQLDKQGQQYINAVNAGEIPSAFDVRDKKGNYDLQENIGKNGTYLTEEGAQKQFDKKLADAYARKKEIEAAIAEDHRLHGNPLLSYGASIGASNGRTAEQSDYSNKLATSLALVNEQIGALEAVKQHATSSWGEDALKALDNTAFTAKTWDFGLTDFATMGQMERIKTKMDNNIPLSGSDKMLLKSKLGADAAAALEDEKMGNIYRWTKIAGQSLPFMADFFLTGGYGGITKGISRGALKFAAKRGMGKVSAAILKNTGIVAGDVIGSYAMAGTEQALKTGADIMQRHLGNLYQDEKGDYKFGTFDENGNLLHEGGESIGTALYKGMTSAMVENYTEKLFGHNYGIKKGAVNFMETHGMNASAEFFKNIGKSGWYTNSKKWMEKFGINGFAEEVMEEEIGIPLHALLDGEGKVSDLLDAKQQLDIIGGMAISVGSMYAMGAGSRPVKGIYNRAQYYRFRNKVNVADSDAQNLMGDNWADIKDKIDNATNEQMGGVLADILRQRDTMTKEQINAAVNYGVNLMKMRGYNIAKTAEMNAKEITNEPTTPEEQHQADIDNAYSEGHDADDADKHDIQIQQEDQMKTLAAALGISEQQLSAMSDEELESLTGQDDKLDQAIYDYQLSSARYQGVVDDAQDKVDLAAHQAEQRVDMYTDQSRGSVRNATIKASGGLEDYGVYIISGNIATHDDGSIDVSNSDGMILYYDPTTNSVEHADALMFAELGEELPADDVKAQAVADAKENAIKEVAGIIDGTVEVGSQFNVTDTDGTEHTYEVLADYGDGTAAISIDGNVVENPYQLADLQQMKDLEDQKRLEAAKAEREQMEKERAAQQTQETEQTQPSFDFNQILNDNGNVVLVDVLDKDGNTKYPDSRLFLIRDAGAKAKVMELKSDGTLVPHAVNKEDVATISSMSLDEYKQAMPESSMIEDNSGEIEVETPTIEGETAAPSEETAAPAITLEDGTIVPMLEDGNPDFSKLTAEQTAELYDSQFGEDADSIVSGYVSDAKKALDKASNITVKGKTFVEQKAAKDAKEKAIADAQAAYDSAIAIRDAYNERQLAKVEDTAEGRKELIEKARRKFARLKSAVKDDAEAVSQLYRDTIGSLLHRLYDGTGIDVTDTIPLTAEEYVASNLGSHSLNYEGTETSKGVKQETGLSREDFAKTQLLAADGKGTTIDALVHSLWENRPSNLESLDTQEIRNALIGVLNSGFKASEARNFVENIRIAQAENILEEQKRAQENAAYAEQHKAEPEAELKAKSDEKAELGAKSEAKLDNESDNKSNDLSNESDNEKTNDKINDNISVPEDATDENPLGVERDESDLPFSAKENGKQQTTAERAADVEKNKVDDMKVVDNIVGKKTRKAFERLAKMMGANIQWQYSDKLGNGWIQETKDADGNVHRTIFITLDSSITEGAQFILGHEMTHQIKNLNPAAYNELTQLVLDTYGSDAFDKAVDETMKRYSDAGFSGRARDYYAEEVVADAVGEMIRDLNLAHTLAMKMSHPLLAAIHEILQKIKLAFFGTEYSDVTKNIIRSIEQAYVKTAKGEVTNSETGEDVSFSLRQKPEPKKKGIGYKVFVLKDGKLYPPMVANPDGAATPVGVWLDADAAPIAGESKTGRPQVKQGGKGTQGGSGKLAYRPGWHLGVVPYAIQFNRKDAEGNKTLFPKNFVFAEVEYAADVDYQEEARQEGINPSGKYQHSLAGLKHLPTDGYYMYRTNPNPETDPWVITGAMKVNRILTRAEQAELVKNAGREPQQIQEGDIVTDDIVNSINQEIADAPKFSLKTYHGTGANFDRFDTSHAYEGAGSETFGHGIYVTKSAKIGASYALNAKVKKIKTPKAFKAIKNGDNWFGRFIDNAVRSSFAKAKKETFNRMDELIKEDENIVNDETKPEWKQNAAQKELADFDKLKSLFEGLTEEDIPSLKRAKANRYEVEIPDDTGNNYLDWNKPMKKEQKKIVREGLEKLGVDVDRLVRNGYSLDKNFGDVYNGLLYYALNGTKFEESDSFVASSNFLSSLGFTGIKYYAGTIWGGAKKGDLNYVIFNEDDAKIVGNTKFSLKKVNDAFNQRLDELVKNPNQKDKILRLGRSSSFLKAGGIADADIELEFDKFVRKSGDKYKNNHPFNASDLKNLPMAIAEPIAVFKSTNANDHVVLTELQKDGKNFIVAIRAVEQHRKGGVVLEVNQITYLYPKEEKGIINWVNTGRISNVDKEKALHFIEALQPHAGTSITDEELKSAANIINSFETTKENGEKVDSDGTKFSLKDEEYLKAVEDGNMEKAQKMVNEAADAAGYSTDSSYQGTSAFNGAAPWGNGYFLTKDERKEAWDNGEFEGESTLGDYINDDIDGGNLEELTNAASYRAADPMRKEAIDNVRNAIQKKANTITMYRSVPSDVKEGSFRNGDWVTPSRSYAVDNAKLHGWGDDYNIIEQKVPVDDVWFDGNDIAEWGYGREEDYINDTDFAYKNTKNNKKLLDAVTYDDEGNVIPLSKRFNEADTDIRFSLKSMMEKPEGWKQANKKAIHIAEAIERDHKFSLKNLDGTLIKAGTYFSGGGLVEEGLKGIIDPVVAVEYDEKISGVYRNNFGQHIVTADVRDVDPKELVKQIDGEVEYFHASPVCKNYSQAKSNHAEVELDKETAASTAEFINSIKPKVVTIENVKGYKDSDAMKTITDALDANGYTWDADVYNAADYGGYTNRERLIVRAVRDGKLPEKPKKMAHKSGWYEAVADIIPTLTEKKNGVAPWMDIRLKADGIDWRNIDKPLYVMGSAYADGKIPHAFADELLPTLRTKSGDVIVMPDGKVYRAMGRVLARVSGVSDDYKMPFSESLSHTIIGNGIPTQLTEHVIAPLLQNTLRPTTPEDGNIKFSLRYDQFEHDLNQWKKDNNLPKDAQRPTIPQRNAGESAVDFLRRVDEYRKQMALWKTAPTYEQHLLSDDTALGEFNRELQRGSVLKRIAFQDSMLAIRKAQEAIMKEVGVDRLNMAEDAYTAENRSHGKGKNEFEEYNNEFLQPLRKAYHQMKKILGDSYDNVRIYMMNKHGLERDAQMAFKKSLEADYEDVAQRSAAYKAYKGDMNRIINDSDLEFGRVDFTTWRQRDNALRVKYSPSYMNYRYDKNGIAYDYSGLSALFDGSDFEEAAYKLVKDIEDKYVTETHNLWDATNAATKKILRDGYKAGMMSKDTYQYVRDMYSHYIPLRGWDGTTADQVWDYIGGGKGAFNQTLKKAHGRTSIADDPIAYIENMAESGILLNNKNWVKQHLMLLAQNHPTSLLTLSKAWYVKSVDDNGNEEWIPATPQITSQMDSNQVKAAIDAFEKKMEQMAQTGDATQKRDGLNIAYPQTHSEEREHEVRVMKDGEEYVIYVNGEPQLAQAMNNTRAHRVREIQSGKLDRAAAWLGRKMAAAYTSLSPLFIPSNYFRDLTMTLASTAIREDAKYNYLLRKNLATSWNLGFMLRDYQNGKLRDKVNNGNATPKEQMFYDFMMNGGETGFVSSLDVEDLKKKFKNDLKDLDRWKANPVKVRHTIMDGIEFLNRAIEDSNRFAVYMTSIQYGRSIDEAVNDAKDVTLNFNRKGTGEYGWQMIRNLYLFINPAVQSLQTLGALAKHHPFKFTAVTASWLVSGVLVPIVNAALMNLLGGDDDKDKYWQFTKWDRRNNLIMWVPFTHEFVKIPLAQEFRAFYGLGDMIASKMMGGELAEESWSQYAEDLLGQVVDMLPLDPTGYDGNIAVSLMPNAIRPVFELAFNVDFTGKPLFKETEYNKYDPNFTKAYVGTPDWLVRISRMVNSIGNDYPDVQQNSIDAFGDPKYNLNNPAVVDHVLSSYLGGAYTMGSQVLGVLTKSLNDPKEIKVADIPLFSKFVSNPDDRPVTKKQGDEFWNMKENHDRAANTLSKLKKQAKVDGDYSMLERFYGSEEYKQYKQDDVKVKKYEEDKKKERAEESGEEYRPHKLNAEDIYKAHATPKDDFEDLKLKQLYTKLNGFKSAYDLLVDTAPSQSDSYYNTNKAAIDAIDEISIDKQEISELKKGFLDDGKDAYNAEDMKLIRELRKKILAVLEKANKVVVANQKAKTEK